MDSWLLAALGFVWCVLSPFYSLVFGTPFNISGEEFAMVYAVVLAVTIYVIWSIRFSTRARPPP